MMTTLPHSNRELPPAIRWEPTIQHRNYFLMGGLAFLGTALILYVLTGYMLFLISQRGIFIQIPVALLLSRIRHLFLATSPNEIYIISLVSF